MYVVMWTLAVVSVVTSSPLSELFLLQTVGVSTFIEISLLNYSASLQSLEKKAFDLNVRKH